MEYIKKKIVKIKYTLCNLYILKTNILFSIYILFCY